MTRMSESHARTLRSIAANHVQSWRGSRLARVVHGVVTFVEVAARISLLFVVGCVIPPSLEVDNIDAGVNSPPAILLVSSDQSALPEPGPVSFDKGPTAGNLSIKLIDTDVADMLFVRVFVDYNLPDRLPARSTCAATPNGTPKRTATCGLSSLCAQADLGVQRTMSIVVFDRMPLDKGEPAFQDLPKDGLSASRLYFLQCRPPQT